MNSMKLLFLSLRYHFDSQKSNPMNLIAGTLGMIINNLIVLWGLWAMLFNNKPNGESLTVYFLALNAMITIAWGSLLFFLGGFRSLGEYIEEGSLEPMLSTPRHPLLLVGISQSSTPALGDIIQGFLNIAVLCFMRQWEIASKTLIFSFFSAMGFLSLFILAGSFAFFLKRGNALSQLFIECNLSLSFYPTGKIFTDFGKFLIMLTPAAFTGLLPITAIEYASLENVLNASIGSILFFSLACLIFNLGVKKFQSSQSLALRN